MVGDDFDESDEPPAKPDSDSDFQLDGNDDGDSGSDWEKHRGSQKVTGMLNSAAFHIFQNRKMKVCIKSAVRCHKQSAV